MFFAISPPISAQRKTISPRACEGDIEVFWGLIWVMIWQKTCNSLFITYLIVIFKVALLFIELWLFLSFFPRIITQNSRITWGKVINIREYIDRVCDNNIILHVLSHNSLISWQANYFGLVKKFARKDVSRDKPNVM